MDSKFQKPINIGNPNEFTIKKLAFLVRELISPNLEFDYKLLPQDDPKQRQADIKLAQEILNWNPNIELRDGLIKTIKWFRSNL